MEGVASHIHRKSLCFSLSQCLSPFKSVLHSYSLPLTASLSLSLWLSHPFDLILSPFLVIFHSFIQNFLFLFLLSLPIFSFSPSAFPSVIYLPYSSFCFFLFLILSNSLSLCVLLSHMYFLIFLPLLHFSFASLVVLLFHLIVSLTFCVQYSLPYSVFLYLCISKYLSFSSFLFCISFLPLPHYLYLCCLTHFFSFSLPVSHSL